MPDRTPLHRAMIAAGMTYVGAEQALRLAAAIKAEGLALVSADDLEEVCVDLAGHIESDYPMDTRSRYPSVRRKYDRDIAPVNRLLTDIGLPEHD